LKTFIVAEIGSTWELDLEKLRRLARAIKDADADCLKLQWTSSGLAMAQRRCLGEDAAAMYYKWLQYDPALLIEAKGIADSVGLEFMCSTFLIQDIAVVAPLVSKFKVSAFESGWYEFVNEHFKHRKEVIVSCNYGTAENIQRAFPRARLLHCVSKYPTAIENLSLRRIPFEGLGFSCHCPDVRVGAWAVIAGAGIVEAHVRLWDTDPSNPDYGHSLQAEGTHVHVDDNPKLAGYHPSIFREYVSNIRIAERCL
jgi:sialic acid synthase SpsE